MAYPATPPPAGRTDSTPLPTNHPDDHNLISAAITDIVNELGSNPKGSSASVTARLNAINALPSVQAGRSSVTTGSGGVVSFTFPTAFTAAPTVVATGELGDTVDMYVSARSATGFSLTLPSLGAGFIRNINWVAVGTLA